MVLVRKENVFVYLPKRPPDARIKRESGHAESNYEEESDPNCTVLVHNVRLEPLPLRKNKAYKVVSKIEKPRLAFGSDGSIVVYPDPQ